MNPDTLPTLMAALTAAGTTTALATRRILTRLDLLADRLDRLQPRLTRAGAEFGTSRLRPPREERTEVVGSLRDAGLSIRAIAAATGDSYGTVQQVISFDHPKPAPPIAVCPDCGNDLDGAELRGQSDPAVMVSATTTDVRAIR